MILGVPKDKDKYICVKSVDAEKLHKIGYIPVYREIKRDRIYFIKTKEICETVDAINCTIIS